ncbi:hypothetical protein ACIHCM_23320 [Streptomyces sp. NPDC052023]|uniref:hypothetical protein n=1 Tax=Streptomyces sp. NPDC052023 TaxID=3365681 RepID=UPI0037D13599
MTEHEFEPHPRAAPEVIAEREALAGKVCTELERAGLPVYRGDLTGGPYTQPGADVHVTPFIDGGVYVDWEAGEDLRSAALALLEKGMDLSDPPRLFRHHRNVLQHMEAALQGILASAGFEIAQPDPHGHGSMIQVMGHRG